MKKTTEREDGTVGLAELLEIRPGVTAVIGGGGKTTLLRTLGEELAGQGRRVVLCTTTKIYPFPRMENLVSPTEAALQAALENHRLVCAGAWVPGGEKLTAPELSMAQLAVLADYVLVEADGSAQRPVKAHALHEPVIPQQANQTIMIVGASGFGRPIVEAAHRPARYALLADLPETASVTPEAEAAVLRAESLHDRVYINQAETAAALRYAAALAGMLDCPAAAGSLRRGEYLQCSQ